MSDTAFIHPEWVGDRHIWLDGDILHKIQFGDPTKGWEGDDLLAVFWNPIAECFELVRWENGDYSVVARQKSGEVFDERIIEELVRRDMARNPKRDLHQEILDSNEAVEARAQADHDELVREEVAPRLYHAFKKDGTI